MRLCLGQNTKEYFTNIYPLINLHHLDQSYTLFEIRSTTEITERDKQHIIKKLSFQLKHPVTIILHNQKPHLVLLSDTTVIQQLEDKLDLVGKRVRFVPTGQIIALDFGAPSSEVKKICLRVLQFSLQGFLANNHGLWQPSSGKPFFKYHPFKTEKGIDIFEGFSARVVEVHDNNFGISIDTTKKYISQLPYPKYLNSGNFSRYYKGNHCLYKFGTQWYELRPFRMSDDSVSQAEIKIGKG